MDLAEVIVVIGGCDRKGLLKLPFADAYHPESRRWTPLPSLPGYRRSEFATCALRNDIYVSGEGKAEVEAPRDWLITRPFAFPSNWEIGAGFFLIPYSYWLKLVCSLAEPITGVTPPLFGKERLRISPLSRNWQS